MRFLKLLKYYIDGPYKTAVKRGMQVGKKVSVMGGANFGSEPYLITLDDEVCLSYNVTILTHDGGIWTFRDRPEYKDVIKYGRVHIGARSFIGCNSTIMPGVTIGKRCVIGAGSVVTKNVPDGCVVAGVPARVIMTTEEYAQKSLNNLKPYDKEAYFKDKKSYLQEYLK